MAELKLSKQDVATVRQLLAVPRPCLLCGGPPFAAGIFIPTAPAAWGGLATQTRLVGYALCKKCFALPDGERSTRIEGKLAAGLVGRQN